MLHAIFFILLTSKFLLSQVNQEWVARYDEPINSDDEANSILVDGSGNVYVTGNNQVYGNNYSDYVTIKYNSAGERQWIARYFGTSNNWYRSDDIAVDRYGNVYVTGTSYDTVNNTNFCTIKYNSAGIEEWVSKYNGPENDRDEATSIAVDSSGNVIVTGSCLVTYPEYRYITYYATVKYNSAGVQLWAAIYNPGILNSVAFPTSLAADVSGNVYVTGTGPQFSAGRTQFYTTVKYNSEGIEEWVKTYGLLNSDNWALSIALDRFGNIYVTGFSEGDGTGYDYATIKYNSYGAEQWIARYDWGLDDLASSIVVDSWGNVYVTGQSYDSETGSDYATLKYNSLGEKQWERRFSGPGYNHDRARSIALDGSNSVYVTGLSGPGYVTIKYNSIGEQQWVSIFGGSPSNNEVDISYVEEKQQWESSFVGSLFPQDLPPFYVYKVIAVDGSGNVYITGVSTIKYNSAGSELWAAGFIGPVNSDKAYSIAADESGNVYVTGESGSDYATIKYNSVGAKQWAARYNGTGNSQDETSSIAIDNSGNVYVTGNSYGIGTGSDYATIKYDLNGVEQWVQKYNGPGNSDDTSFSIAVDNSGNVYVTGVGGGDFATIKYSASGVQQWVERFGSANYYDAASSIAIDNSGNVYVTGESYGGSGTSYDYATIKYNGSGIQQWVSRYKGPGNLNVASNSIAIDRLSNVYVTGWTTGIGSSADYITIKYNSFGVQQWVANYNGPGNSLDYTKSIAVDSSENVYVTGVSMGSVTGLDYATIKYNSSGVQQWVSRYDSPDSHSDLAKSIAINGLGDVYVTGYTRQHATGEDYATIKYNAAGIEQWVEVYNGAANADDEATSIAVDASNNVYVTGYSFGSETDYDFATIKYSQEINNNLPMAATLPHPDGDGTLNQVAKYIYARDTVYKPLDCGTNQIVIVEPCDPWVLTFYVAFWIQGPGGVKTRDLFYNWDTTECQDIRFDYIHPQGYDSSMYSDSIVLKVTMIPHEIDFCNHDTVESYICMEYPYCIIHPLCWRSCFNERITFTVVDSSFVPNVVMCSIEFDKPLPVELASFTSAVSGNNVILKWTTSTEKNNKGFTLQRGTESIWKDIGFIEGKGNSTSPADYSFTDRNLNSGLYNYRLMQLDFNGNIEYLSLSNQVVIGTPDRFTLSQNYPNPFNPTTTIVYGIPKDGFVSLRIYDINGREIKTLVNELKTSGYYTITFDAGNLSSGVYFYKLESGKFISARKFVLLK